MADDPWINTFPHPVAAYLWDVATGKWIPAPSGVLVVSGPLTDAQLRAAPVPVSLDEPISVSFFDARIAVIGFPEDIVWSGLVDHLEDLVTADSGGLTTVGVGIVTVTAWVGTLLFEASPNGIGFYPCPVVNAATGKVVTYTTESGIFTFPCAGYMRTRVRASEWESGSVLVTLRGSVGSNIGTLPLSDAQLRESPVPVSGSMTQTEMKVLGLGHTLLQMLDELKRMNMQLSLITDEEV